MDPRQSDEAQGENDRGDGGMKGERGKDRDGGNVAGQGTRLARGPTQLRNNSKFKGGNLVKLTPPDTQQVGERGASPWSHEEE